jgi:hypothetical protein
MISIMRLDEIRHNYPRTDEARSVAKRGGCFRVHLF